LTSSVQCIAKIAENLPSYSLGQALGENLDIEFNRRSCLLRILSNEDKEIRCFEPILGILLYYITLIQKCK